MNNKIQLKSYLLKTGIVSVILLMIFIFTCNYEYRVYTNNFNNKIGEIVTKILEKYPNINESEIISILNNDENNSVELFEKYGIDLDTQSILIENDNYYKKFIILKVIFFIVIIFSFLFLFLMYNKRRNKSIESITRYLEQINKKNYDLNIESNSEGQLSILKNEIYKTTVMLKEVANNSKLDKLNLKKSLEDISHQLKTPLTSILIILDNLIDDENMNVEMRNDFIKNIKREIMNINFLVQEILKLSKFESNTIEFIKKDIEIKEIIKSSIDNVLLLCDLKNIEIIVEANNYYKIKCDYRWEIEAITNILKNCIEYSENGQKIIINFQQNNIYFMIKIKSFGKMIDKKDLPHIFERFYRGKNSNSEGIGIGLALSKAIINEDNGTIDVFSNKKETTFIIKYYRI